MILIPSTPLHFPPQAQRLSLRWDIFSQQSFSKRTLRPQEYQFYDLLLNHNFSAVVYDTANYINTVGEKQQTLLNNRYVNNTTS